MTHDTKSGIVSGYRGFNLIYLSLLYGCGAFALNMTPVMLGSFIEQLQLTKTSAGLVVTLEIVSMGVASIGLAHYLHKTPIHKTLRLILAGLLSFNLLSSIAPNMHLLAVTRVLTGICSGSLLAITLYLIARSPDHVRLLGLSLTGSLLSGSFFLAITPAAVIQWQLPGLFLTAASFPLLLLLFLKRFQPAENTPEPPPCAHENKKLAKLPGIAYLFIAAVLMIHIAQGGYYSFIEVLGSDLEMKKTTIGFTLSLSYLLALLGSLTTSAIGNRFGMTLPLLIGMCGQSASVATVVFTTDPTYFIGAVCLQSFFYFLFTPFLLGAANKIDPSGKLSAVGMGIIITGLGFAPVLYGILLTNFTTAIIAWCMISSALFAFLSLHIIIRAPSASTTHS